MFGVHSALLEKHRKFLENKILGRDTFIAAIVFSKKAHLPITDSVEDIPKAAMFVLMAGRRLLFQVTA